MTADLIVDAQAELGECPVWDQRSNILYFIDTYRCRIYGFHPDTEELDCFRLDQPVGAIVLRECGGLVVAVADGLLALDPRTGEWERLFRAPGYVPGYRFNDGKCDSRGRLWVGSIVLPAEYRFGDTTTFDRAGQLMKFSTSSDPSIMVGQVGISNGLGWSPADDTFYYTDSLDRRVNRFDYEPVSGAISGRQSFVDLSWRTGIPDGLTVDVEGGVWIASHGPWGGVVERYDPEGDLTASVPLECPATSCVFGGEAYGTLFITTSRSGLNAYQLSSASAAGGVFCCMPGVKGLPPNHFVA